MAAAFLVAGSVSASVPGLSAEFAAVGSSLEALYAKSVAARDVISSSSAVISAQLEALGVAQLAIEASATADVDAAIAVSSSATASLTADLANPALYFQGLIEGLGQVGASLSADLALPAVSLGLAIGVNLDATAGLELQRLAILATIAPLSAIADAVSAAVGAMASVVSALSTALSAAALALARVASMNATLAVGTMYAMNYTGPLSGMGAGLDLASPAAGVPGSTPVTVTLQFVDSADAPAVSAQAAVLRAS